MIQQPAPNDSKIDTDGGAFIGRDANTDGGDFVGRDKNLYGKEIIENKIVDNHADFKEPNSGIFNTGSGDVNVFVSNLGDAIRIIRQSVPQEQTDAIEQLTKALVQLSKYQKIVNELKKIHNMLHRLEADLSMVEAVVKLGQATIPLHVIEYSWSKTVRPSMLILEEFAAHGIFFLDEIPFKVTNEKVEGPYWIKNLFQKRLDFESSIAEKNAENVHELAFELLNVCRENLFRVDVQLLESIDKLDQFSNSILKVINING